MCMQLLTTWLQRCFLLEKIAVRGSRPGKQVQLEENEIKFLCNKAREILISQPILLELEAPIKICGTPRAFPPLAFPPPFLARLSHPPPFLTRFLTHTLNPDPEPGS